MSETYYSGYDSDRGRKPRRSLLLRLLDLLMTLLTAVTAVTMVVKIGRASCRERVLRLV